MSVPAARRFVADGLMSWGRSDLMDDATLCVSELAGNAALHTSSTFMHIGLGLHRDVVRVSVEDDGAVPAQAVTPRPSFPDPADPADLLLEDEATTGRGLAIVSILASDWGVEKTLGGKRVWCEITGTADEHGVRLPKIRDEEAVEQSEQLLPAGWARVRLAGCPVRLSLRQDEHLDELIRELQLAGAARANPTSQALALELQDLLSGPAHARHMGRRIAQRAAAEGREFIDVDMAMPREFSAEVEKLDVAVKAADVLCEEMRLLTLASSGDLRALRAWMTEEVVRQARYGQTPVPWEHWLLRGELPG
ncbi:MAG: ATP-binding protein [Nocardioides sp.]|uniref:ATP-binding protein n=1 Tax=Nocardioides sp. TaxID=35761 RepID=UPI0032670235